MKLFLTQKVCSNSALFFRDTHDVLLAERRRVEASVGPKLWLMWVMGDKRGASLR